jgi:hypothetical protein
MHAQNTIPGWTTSGVGHGWGCNKDLWRTEEETTYHVSHSVLILSLSTWNNKNNPRSPKIHHPAWIHLDLPRGELLYTEMACSLSHLRAIEQALAGQLLEPLAATLGNSFICQCRFIWLKYRLCFFGFIWGARKCRFSLDYGGPVLAASTA